MATKFNIQGDLIGTTAENVEYTKSGWQEVTNAKAALDDLQERLSEVEGGGGSTPISSAEDVPYAKQGWSGIANVKQALDDLEPRLVQAEGGIECLNGGVTISADGYRSVEVKEVAYSSANSSSLAIGSIFSTSSYSTASYIETDKNCSIVFDLFEGETLHYRRVGNSKYAGNWHWHAIVIVDKDEKVLFLTPASEELAEGTLVAPVGSKRVYIHAAWNNKPTAWASYTGKPHVKRDVEVYACLGDSISTDSGVSGERPITYPRIIAKKFGAVLNRFANGGWGAQAVMPNSWNRVRSDADVLTIALGINDVAGVSAGNVTMGSASDALAILPADVDPFSLTSSAKEELTSTLVGAYWYGLSCILTHIVKPDATIACISPFGNGTPSYQSGISTLKTELGNLVTAINAVDTRVRLIDGELLLQYRSEFFAKNDTTHPNAAGELLIAEMLYVIIKEIRGTL